MPSAAGSSRKGPLTAERSALAARYVPLAKRLAGRHGWAWPHLRDEFLSAATMALSLAARDFDPSRGVPFGAYARLRIEGAICDVRRGALPSGFRYGDADAPRLEAWPSTSLALAEYAGAAVLLTAPDDPAGSDSEAIEATEAMIRRLPRRHAEVCRRLYVLGETQTEAAAALGMSQPRVSSVHREALALLRWLLTTAREAS